MSEQDTLPAVAGALIGYRRNGQPIYLAAGGSEDSGDGGDDATVDDAIEDDGDDTSEDTTDWRAEAERHQADAAKWKRLSRKNEADLRALQQRSTSRAGDAQGDTGSTDDSDDGRITEAEARANSAQAELRVHRIASKLGVDADALLDSRAFIDAVEDIADDLEPGDWDGFDAKVADLIKKRGGKKTGTSRSGGEFAGGSNAGRPITEEQLARMSPDDIAKAFDQGRLKHLL